VVLLSLPVTGDGVVIDRLVAGDAAALARSHSDPENARFQGWKSPLSEEEALAFIEEHATATPADGVQLAIREHLGGELAGDLYLHQVDDVMEVGITLVPGFGGRGLATSTIAAVAGAVGALTAWVHVDNVRSRALFERLGFRLVEQTDDEVRYEVGPGECRVGPRR
jgi:RimJ/RimL family protein N-acetyltransferase